MDTIIESVHRLPADATPRAIVDHLSDAVFTLDTRGACASVSIYSRHLASVVTVGDTQIVINGERQPTGKLIDDILARVRREHILDAINNGATIDDIRANDIGRAAILGVLAKQEALFANAGGALGYGVINGNVVRDEHIHIHPAPAGATVILASDGYPVLHDTLAATERALADLLDEDPLCIGALLGTKTIPVGATSFDDRTYIRFNAC